LWSNGRFQLVLIAMQDADTAVRGFYDYLRLRFGSQRVGVYCPERPYILFGCAEIDELGQAAPAGEPRRRATADAVSIPPLHDVLHGHLAEAARQITALRPRRLAASAKATVAPSIPERPRHEVK